MELLALYTIAPLLSSIFFLFLGSIVYFKNRKSTVNITFALVCFVTFWWQFSWFILFNTQNEASANFLVRFGHVGIIFIPIFFFHFLLSFLRKVSIFDRYLLYFSYLVGLIFEVLLITDYFINGFYKYFWGFYPRAGILHPFFLFLIAILAIRGIYLLISHLKKKKLITNIEYYQTKYFLLALIFYIFASSDFLVNYGVEFYPTGFLFILIFLGITALAISKYHLFEIRVILTEILVGAMGIILLILPFLMPTSLLRFLTVAIFFFFCFFGYYLIKATHEESRRREEAEKLAIRERALRLQTERLAGTREQFLLSSQHYFRTPLTSLIGYLEMVLEEKIYGKLPQRVKEKLNFAFQSSKELRKRIEEGLNIAQFQAGKGILNLQETQIEDLVKKAIRDLKFEAERKNLSLEYLPPKETLPKIQLDENRIIEALTHLIDNGIKHTEKGGAMIGLEYLKDKNSILFWVKDTGIGIPKEELAQIGQIPFERGKEAKKLTPLGKGLGLYLTRLIIEAHQGKIWAESEGKGKGSTFFIELPIK